MTQITSRLLSGCAVLAIAAGLTLHPAPARAGVFIALPPVVIGAPIVPYPPAYYYPPTYYGYPAYAPQLPPPAAPAPQMSRADAPYGSICRAGFYSCAAPAQTQVGSSCSCPGIGAPSYGSVR